MFQYACFLAARAPEARGEAKEAETRGRAVIQHLHHGGCTHDKHDGENRAQTETRHVCRVSEPHLNGRRRPACGTWV